MHNNPSTGVARACVVAGDINTPYSRAGQGEALVLLAGDPAFRDAMLAALPRHLCAIVPDFPPQGWPDLTAWLWGFLDALGIERVTFVVTQSAEPVLRAAIYAQATRIVGLTVVRDATDAPGIAAAVRAIVDFLRHAERSVPPAISVVRTSGE